MAGFAMSVDGFEAGPDQCLEHLDIPDKTPDKLEQIALAMLQIQALAPSRRRT